MTQSELAKKTGIGRNSISDYLKGKYLAKQKHMMALAKALNVNKAWLMGYDTYNNNFTDKDIDRFFDSIHYYRGQKINEMQRKFMRDSIKSFLETQREMSKDQDNKKKGD